MTTSKCLHILIPLMFLFCVVNTILVSVFFGIAYGICVPICYGIAFGIGWAIGQGLPMHCDAGDANDKPTGG